MAVIEKKSHWIPVKNAKAAINKRIMDTCCILKTLESGLVVAPGD